MSLCEYAYNHHDVCQLQYGANCTDDFMVNLIFCAFQDVRDETLFCVKDQYRYIMICKVHSMFVSCFIFFSILFSNIFH